MLLYQLYVWISNLKIEHLFLKEINAFIMQLSYVYVVLYTYRPPVAIQDDDTTIICISFQQNDSPACVCRSDVQHQRNIDGTFYVLVGVILYKLC